eukprot:126669-Pyramimonas_sp.AAC.1
MCIRDSHGKALVQQLPVLGQTHDGQGSAHQRGPLGARSCGARVGPAQRSRSQTPSEFHLEEVQ